jgi:nitrate reductase NapE component
MANPIKPFVVLAVVIFSVMIYMVIGPALLGALGSEAKQSDGSDGEGFSVSDSTIDEGADIALVQIPTLTMGVVAVWGFLSILMLLAYVGVI